MEMTENDGEIILARKILPRGLHRLLQHAHSKLLPGTEGGNLLLWD
jgi:hypothetical protein